jgi:RNA polymerase sigma-70 factor
MPHNHKKELRTKFEQVFLQNSGKIFNFVLSVSNGNNYLAEEVTQTAFQKLWEQLDSSATVENMTSYLFTAAKNIMFNLSRHETVKWIYQNYLMQHRMESELTTDQTIEGNFMMQYIRTLLEEMPPMRRKVFEMSKLDYYSTKEIAEQLNLSVSTIETHIQLGLRFMREELRKRYGIVVSMMFPIAALLPIIQI